MTETYPVTDGLEQLHADFPGLRFEVQGMDETMAVTNLRLGLGLVRDFMGQKFSALDGLQLKIGDGLVFGGGQTFAEQNLIVFDAHNNTDPWDVVRPHLVAAGEYDADDWHIPLDGSQPGSSLVPDLVHEIGHIIDDRAPGMKNKRLAPGFSPTKYGRHNSREAFAESFAYQVFGLYVPQNAGWVVQKTIESLPSHD